MNELLVADVLVELLGELVVTLRVSFVILITDLKLIRRVRRGTSVHIGLSFLQ